MPDPLIPGVPTLPALDALATPVLLLAPDDRVRYASPACAAWLGLSPRRLLDQPVAALAAGEGALASLPGRARALNRPVVHRHLRFTGGDGGDCFADAWATPLGDTPLGVGADLALELHPVAEFPGADPEQALPAALSAALRGIAHEVKNPLAGLRGAAQLLGRRLADPDAQRYLEVITAEADRLTALVERLLSPAPPNPLAPTNVHAVLERVRLLAEAEAGWAVAIQRDYDPSLPELAGDADRLLQAVWNLVRNALEAGSSEVRLRTRAEHNAPIGERVVRLAVRVEVIDNGRGVPEALGARIFLPLVTARAEGTGLGLPLAQQVAREHGGALTYRSRPGHTVFTLMLPVDAGAES